MLCDDISIQLAEAVEPGHQMAMPTEVHLGSCLRCQAELAQYRKLLRGLKSLRYDLASIEDDFLPELLDAVRPPATVHRLHGTGRRRAYIGGIAAAATAGAAGALVLATRITRPHIAS